MQINSYIWSDRISGNLELFKYMEVLLFFNNFLILTTFRCPEKKLQQTEPWTMGK